MFIDVTRHGGLKVLRLSVSAIAYLSDLSDGCAIHLIGGEAVRVNEDLAVIEARCMAPTADLASLPAPSTPRATNRRKGR
jgi:hypothetical protein